MSSESDFAWRMASAYRNAGIIRAPRVDRVAWAQSLIAGTYEAIRQDDQAHKQQCVACQRGEFCLHRFSLSPLAIERTDRVGFLRCIINSEERDQAYARHAQAYGVEYAHHIDGFCAYWQNVRWRKFASVDWLCEHCFSNAPLDAHHLHYDTLGFEEIDDLEALCRPCHEDEHA